MALAATEFGHTLYLIILARLDGLLAAVKDLLGIAPAAPVS